MKGPSLERQYNAIQEQIKERIDVYKSKSECRYPNIEAGIIKSMQQFYLQESDYLYDPKYPVGMGVGPIRWERWEFYKLDEEKFKVCKTKDKKDLNCRECRCCGLFAIDGHYSIPCYNIMRISKEM